MKKVSTVVLPGLVATSQVLFTRFRRNAAIGVAVSFLLFLSGPLALRGDTFSITSDASAGRMDSAGTATKSFIYAGTLGSVTNSGVLMFRLPALPAGHKVISADLSVHVYQVPSPATFGLDLYALRVNASSNMASGDYYAGPYGPSAGHVPIMNDFIPFGLPVGTYTVTNVTGRADMAAWIQTQYEAGAVSNFVFFGLSPDSAAAIAANRMYRISNSVSMTPPKLILTTADLSSGPCRLMFANVAPAEFVQKPFVTTNLSFGIRNSGTDATNVAASLAANYPWLANNTGTNSIALIGFGNVVTSVFNVAISSNAPVGVYSNAFTLNMQGNGTDGSTSNSSAQVGLEILNTVFCSMSKTSFAADTNGTDTATLTVSNQAAFDLSFSLINSPSGSWLSYPAGTQTVSANSSAAITITANGSLTAGQGQYSGSLSVTYLNNTSVPNPTNFSLLFDVGPKIEPLIASAVITEVGGVNLLPGQYEQGEILNITITSTNNGAITVANIAHTLSVNSAYLTILPVSNTADYALMATGASTTSTYQVTIAAGTPLGTYTFSATNSANGKVWANTRSLSVVSFGSVAKIEPLMASAEITEVGGVNWGSGVYEPGEILNITFTSTNNGAITVANILNTLSADPAYFTITTNTSADFASMAVGFVTTTTYQVTISATTPDGAYLFSASNSANGASWINTRSLTVLKVAAPTLITMPSSSGNDGRVGSDGTITKNLIYVGDAGGTMQSGVVMFKLPLLPPGYRVVSANLSMLQYQTVGSSYAFKVDLYALRRSSSPNILPADYYSGSYAASAERTPIETGFVPTGSGSGTYSITNATSKTDMGNWVQAQYDAGATTNEFVFFGLSVNGTALANQTYRFRAGSYPTDTPKLTLTLQDFSRVSPASITMNTLAGGVITNRMVVVTNAGDDALTFSITDDGVWEAPADRWVSYTPAQDVTVAPHSSQGITFIADTSGKTAATSITFNAWFNWSTGGSNAVIINAKSFLVTNLVIQGASRLLPYSTNLYTCQEQYSDGISSNVTGLAEWSLIGSGAMLSGNVLSAGNIAADSTVTLQAVYGGVTNTCSVMLTEIPAGVLAAWDFYGLPGIPAPGAVTAAVYTVSSAPVITRVGLTSSGSTNRFRATGFPTNQTMDEAVSAGKYFTFTLSNTTPVAITDVSMSIYRNGPYAPTGFTLRVSTDAGFSTYTEREFKTGSTAYNNNIGMSNLNVSGTSVYFRLYGYGSSNNYAAGFAGTTNSGVTPANSGLDGTLYDLTVYGHGAMTVTPIEGSSFVKISDDPVVPLSRIYTVSNAAGSSIDWTASCAQPWVTVIQSNGMLEAGGSTNVSVSINADANEPPVGVYEDTIVFRNSLDSMFQNRPIQLRVIKATSLTIEGSTRLAAYSTNTYTCRAQYTDGSRSNVTDSATWDLIGAGATLNGNALSVGNIASDSTVTIQAVYDSFTNTYPVILKYILPGLTPLGMLFTNATADAQAIIYSNGYAYVACGNAGVIIFDVSTSTNIVKVGGYDTDGDANGLTLRSNLLFVADGNADLLILDVNNPSNPVPSGRWKSDYDPAYIRKIVISGQYAYLAAGTRGLLVLDISNISDPRLVSDYDTANAYSVVLDGNYAYVTDYTNGLKIIDVSTPTNPVLTGSYPVVGQARDIAVKDGYAYVAAYTNGLQIINVSIPTNPVYAGGYVTNYSSGIVLDGDFVYLANSGYGLGVIKIKDPSAPVWAGRFDDDKGTANDVSVADGKAFVANGYGGIQIVNVSDLSLLGSYDTHRYAYDVAVKGSYAYLAGYRDGLITVDISNPDAPVAIATNKWVTGIQYAYGVDIIGDTLCIAPYGGLGLIVYDISNPALPSLVTSYDFVSIGSIVDIKIYSNYTFCVNNSSTSTNALAVLDVSNPGNPFYVSGYNTGGAAYDVEVQDQYAYLASGTNGLQIFDVANPSNIVLAGSYIRPPINEFESQPSYVRRVAISGNYVYMLGSGVTLAVVDVSDRQSPKLAGLCDLGKAGVDSEISVQYPYVFIAYDTGFQMPERNGLWVIDVSDPASPVVVADYSTSGYSRGVTVNNGHVYLADDPKGLHTFTWGAVPTPSKSVTNFVVYRFSGGNRLETLSAKTTNSYEGYVEYSDRSIQSVSTTAVWTVVGEPQGAVFNANHLTADGVTSNGAVITVQGSYLGFSDTLNVTLYYDRNTNGVPDWWELQYSGSITGVNPNGVCSNGFNTLREAYIAGLDPNDPQSALRVSASPDGKLIGWNAVSGRFYSVYFSTNLMNGFQLLKSNVPWPQSSFTNSSGSPQGFYKIGVRLTATYIDIYYTLTGSAGANGTVSPTSANVPAGGSVDFTVTASNYYRIASLTVNGTPSGLPFDNSSAAANYTLGDVQTNMDVAATFTEQVANDPAKTPYLWLAGYGLTNYNTDAAADPDGDGLIAWQEYIAGTDPTNAASYLRVTEAPRNVIGWNAVSGRVYSVSWTTNLMNGFQPLGTNILWPQGSFTNLTTVPQGYYKIDVRLE